MAISIRPYTQKDFRYVQDICLETSQFCDNQTPLNRALLCAGYTDYYLDEEPQFCFVAADENDLPLGYVLCSADADNYRELMSEAYLPLVRKLSATDYFKVAAAVKVGEHWAKQGYTAHLQMSVLPDCEQGVAESLLKAILQKLQSSFVEGVFVVCEQKNQTAEALLRKFGFDDIDYMSGLIVFGKKLYVED